MKTSDCPTLSKRELAVRWHVTDRTVRRRLRRYALRSVEFSGKTTLYFISDVERYEKQRNRRADA